MKNALVVLLLSASPLSAQQPMRLGAIDFPNSGAAAAQPAFIRGVLLLHSFEYPTALQAFREAERLDPGFVMAYWGEAMTWTHGVWNQQEADSARASLAKLAPAREARLAKAANARERGYLGAVETLYGDGSKPRRDTLYSRAMVTLMEDNPADIEARTFAALSILSLNQGVRDVPAYMRAAALVQPVFETHPDHPGAAHYLIHSFDDPIHAPLGLAAARAYSRIAPDAGHAQHMTTHIFLALGMWDETISQNVIAADLTTWVPGHYTEWLGYGYLQAGRFRDADSLLKRVRTNMRMVPRQRAELAFMRAQQVVTTEDWNSPLWSWAVDLAGLPLAAAEDASVRGLAAARRNDPAGLAAARADLRRSQGAFRAGPDSLPASKAEVMRYELDALDQQLAGHGDSALALIARATAIEDVLPMDYGPPEIVKPSHELRGEMLLQAGKAADAQREFSRALELAPKRARSLIGLVRAASLAGDQSVAADARRVLVAIWHAADAGLNAML